jgi:hypothetical protein
VIGGRGGDNDLGLYSTRSRRRRVRRRRKLVELAVALLAGLVAFALLASSVLCGVLGLLR